MAQTTAERGIPSQDPSSPRQSSNSWSSKHVPETLSREISNIHNHIQLDILLEQAMTVQSLEEIDTHFS